MKLTPAARSPHYVRSYEAARITLGDQVVTQNSLISASFVQPWEVTTPEALTLPALQTVFALKPEVVILATGQRLRFPSPQVRAAFLAREIGFEVMDIGAACRTFNVLLSEDRQVVLAVMFDSD